MSIADAPTSLSLRERAAIAWREQQREEERRRGEWIDQIRQEYRESLRNSIECSLRVPCDLGAVECPLSDQEIEHGPVDGGALARTQIDGLTILLIRRGHSKLLALEWECPACGVSPVTDMLISSLETLGQLLDYLPTLHRCRRD